MHVKNALLNSIPAYRTGLRAEDRDFISHHPGNTDSQPDLRATVLRASIVFTSD